VLPNVENMGIYSRLNFVAIVYRSRDIRYFRIYFRLMAAIFDFSLIRKYDSLRGSLNDLENMRIAVGISLLSCRN